MFSGLLFKRNNELVGVTSSPFSVPHSCLFHGALIELELTIAVVSALSLRKRISIANIYISTVIYRCNHVHHYHRRTFLGGIYEREFLSHRVRGRRKFIPPRTIANHRREVNYHSWFYACSRGLNDGEPAFSAVHFIIAAAGSEREHLKTRNMCKCRINSSGSYRFLGNRRSLRDVCTARGGRIPRDKWRRRSPGYNSPARRISRSMAWNLWYSFR